MTWVKAGQARGDIMVADWRRLALSVLAVVALNLVLVFNHRRDGAAPA